MTDSSPKPSDALTEKILTLLPQTQCTHCGYVSCRSYAEAIAHQEADINRCAAGGQKGIHRLAVLLDIAEPLLDTAYGEESPRSSATIDESACIGCTICIRICPTDAIIGASGMMHTIVQDFCTGCGQCVPRCPLDAISLHPVSGSLTGWDAWTEEQAKNARHRYERKLARLHSNTDKPLPSIDKDPLPILSDGKKSAVVQKAIERARARLKSFGIQTSQ